MSLKMHHSGGHFYRKIGLMTIQLGSVGFVAFTPIYHATAVHSPSQNQHGSASQAKAEQTKSSRLTKNKKIDSSGASLVLKGAIGERGCKFAPMRSVPGQQSAQITKLLAYERICGGEVFSSMSFFVATPTSDAAANEQAEYVATKLNEFRAAGIRPIVFMEPTANGGLIDMKTLAGGTYDSSIKLFFESLKQRGISSQAMGTWVPIPEGNIPVWSSLDPALYSKSVKRMATIQKATFPGSKVSVLLDTMTYPKSGVWSGGSPKSLSPYLAGLPNGLIDSVGLQGFPWVSPHNQGATTNGSVAEYLKPRLAIDAAHQLGASSAWINSGTFGQKYTAKSEKVIYSASMRSETLHQIVAATAIIKQAGLKASLHIFAEDKLSTGEMTNWSYLGSDETVFMSLAADAHSRGIDLWLFDS